MRSIYASVSLTHVKTDKEKDEVRALIPWLAETFDATVAKWAFNLDKWTPLPCDDINKFDNDGMDASQLMVVVYLTNEGSDGRGGEVIRRMERGELLLAFKMKGVKVSPYIVDGLKRNGITIIEIAEFAEMAPYIRANFDCIEALQAASAR